MTGLYNAHRALTKFNKYLSNEESKKLAQAISDRAGRIFYLAENDKGLTEKSYDFLKNLEIKFHVKPRRPKKNLESTVAVVGLIGGLLFLSSTITGNVIGNASVGVSGVVGALMFVVGFVGAWNLARNR